MHFCFSPPARQVKAMRGSRHITDCLVSRSRHLAAQLPRAASSGPGPLAARPLQRHASWLPSPRLPLLLLFLVYICVATPALPPVAAQAPPASPLQRTDATGAEAADDQQLVAAICNNNIRSVTLINNIRLTARSWPTQPITRSTNFTVLGQDWYPILDLSFVESKVKLLPGVTFTFEKVELRNVRIRSGFEVDIFLASPGAVVRYNLTAYFCFGCLPIGLITGLIASLPTARPDLPPNNVTGGGWCRTQAPLAQCYNATNALHIWNAASVLPESGLAGVTMGGGYVLEAVATHFVCQDPVSEECGELQGYDMCVRNQIQARVDRDDTWRRLNASSVGPGGGGEAGGGGSGGGGPAAVRADARAGGAGGGGGAPVGAIVGGVVGGVAFLAAVVAAAVYFTVRRRRRAAAAAASSAQGSLVEARQKARSGGGGGGKGLGGPGGCADLGADGEDVEKHAGARGHSTWSGNCSEDDAQAQALMAVNSSGDPLGRSPGAAAPPSVGIAVESSYSAATGTGTVDPITPGKPPGPACAPTGRNPSGQPYPHRPQLAGQAAHMASALAGQPASGVVMTGCSNGPGAAAATFTTLGESLAQLSSFEMSSCGGGGEGYTAGCRTGTYGGGSTAGGALTGGPSPPVAAASAGASAMVAGSGEHGSKPVVLVAGISIELTSVIGTGSFGKVFRGCWQGRPVAVKVLQYGAELCQAVHNEVLLSQTLRHPNVVSALYFAQVLPGGRLGLHTNTATNTASGGATSLGTTCGPIATPAPTTADGPSARSSQAVTGTGAAPAAATTEQQQQQQQRQQPSPAPLLPPPPPPPPPQQPAGRVRDSGLNAMAGSYSRFIVSGGGVGQLEEQLAAADAAASAPHTRAKGSSKDGAPEGSGATAASATAGDAATGADAAVLGPAADTVRPRGQAKDLDRGSSSASGCHGGHTQRSSGPSALGAALPLSSTCVTGGGGSRKKQQQQNGGVKGLPAGVPDAGGPAAAASASIAAAGAWAPVATVTVTGVQSRRRSADGNPMASRRPAAAAAAAATGAAATATGAAAAAGPDRTASAPLLRIGRMLGSGCWDVDAAVLAELSCMEGSDSFSGYEGSSGGGSEAGTATPDVLSRWDEQRRRQEQAERAAAAAVGGGGAPALQLIRPALVVTPKGFVQQADMTAVAGGGAAAMPVGALVGAVGVTAAATEPRSAETAVGGGGTSADNVRESSQRLASGSSSPSLHHIAHLNHHNRTPSKPTSANLGMAVPTPAAPGLAAQLFPVSHGGVGGGGAAAAGTVGAIHPTTAAGAAAAALPIEALWLAAHTQPAEGSSHGFLVMELCEGGSVFAWRSAHWGGPEERPDLSVILRLALDIAYGMSYIHSMGICHGDLKLSNVLLARSDDAAAAGTSPADLLAGWVAKVCDFGLSRVLTGDRTHVSTRPYGTPTHMAPELWTKGHMSQPADVYAFGVTMWELATGERPYKGLNAARILHRVLLNGGRPVLPLWLPPSYTRLVASCWAQSPKDRPTFAEIVRHLEAMLAVLAAVTPRA